MLRCGARDSVQDEMTRDLRQNSLSLRKFEDLHTNTMPDGHYVTVVSQTSELLMNFRSSQGHRSGAIMSSMDQMRNRDVCLEQVWMASVELDICRSNRFRNEALQEAMMYRRLGANC